MTEVKATIIKRVKKTTFYDVFKGLGWKDWTRFSYPSMRIVGGAHLPREEVAKVFHTIESMLT